MAGKNLFNSVVMTRPNRNVFDLTHDIKLSCNMGRLVPTTVIDVVPNDSFQIGCESLIRFAPLIAPVMHRFDIYMHYWFVPRRILWEHWEKYITNSDTTHAYPFVVMGPSGGPTNLPKIANYMGIPDWSTVSGAVDEKIDAMPFAAFQMIYNEFYRDQNLITTGLYDSEAGLVDGDNTATPFIFQERLRAWEHDYFTSCLPFAQKGAAVSLPVGSIVLDPAYDQTGHAGFVDSTPPSHGYHPTGAILGQGAPQNNLYSAEDSAVPVVYDPQGSLITDATTINDLRKAFRLQEYLEKLARGGSRYAEFIRNFFGITPEDARLQRPEYITGSKSPVIISEVLNHTGSFDPATPADPSSPPQGAMAGHGVGVVSGNYGRYHAKEHGLIIGIMSIMPKTAYQNGIARQWLKINNPYEFFTPQFANIGEQEVSNREVYAYDPTGDGVFGYNPRYAEYKFCNNLVAGDFRTTLKFWTCARIFAGMPTLSEGFIGCDPREDIFAVIDGSDHLWVQIMHHIKAVRPMPKYGTPHF